MQITDEDVKWIRQATQWYMGLAEEKAKLNSFYSISVGNLYAQDFGEGWKIGW